MASTLYGFLKTPWKVLRLISGVGYPPISKEEYEAVKAVETLTKSIVDRIEEIKKNNKEEKIQTLSQLFCNDPIALLVAVQCSAFVEDIQEVWRCDRQMFVKYVDRHKSAIGFSEAEKLLLSAKYEELFSKEIQQDQKYTLLAYLIDYAMQSTWFVLSALKYGNLSKKSLMRIAEHYVPAHSINRLSVQNALDRNTLLQLLINTLEEGVLLKQTQAAVLQKLLKIWEMTDKEEIKAYLENRDTDGRTLLHHIFLGFPAVVNGVCMKNSNYLFQEETGESLQAERGSIEKIFRDLLVQADYFANKLDEEQTAYSQYQDNQGNTFLHIAAQRGGKADDILLDLSNEKRLETFCNIRNISGKIALELACEAKNAEIVETLILTTTDLLFWKNIFIDENYAKSVSYWEIKRTLQKTKYFSSLKSEYRLLHDKYREAFGELTEKLTYGFWSYGNISAQAKALQDVCQKSEWAARVLTDYDQCFEYLLEHPDSTYLCKALQEHPAVLLAALDEKTPFNAALMQSTHYHNIMQSWATYYCTENLTGKIEGQSNQFFKSSSQSTTDAASELRKLIGFRLLSIEQDLSFQSAPS